MYPKFPPKTASEIRCWRTNLTATIYLKQIQWRRKLGDKEPFPLPPEIHKNHVNNPLLTMLMPPQLLPPLNTHLPTLRDTQRLSPLMRTHTRESWLNGCDAWKSQFSFLLLCLYHFSIHTYAQSTLSICHHMYI